MTSAASHNGGKGQVNFNAVQTGGEFPFINHLKTAQSWSNGTSIPDPSTLDANGYPTSFPISNYVSATFFIASRIAVPKQYVLRWTGNGSVGFNSGMDYISLSEGVSRVGGVLTSTLGGGRVVVDNVSEGVVFQITSTGISDCVFMRLDHETLYDAGEIFNPDFKAAIIEGGIGSLRFLNWFNTNIATMTNWASRKPVGYFSYQAPELRANLFTTTTGASTSTAFVAPAPTSWPGLVDKAVVIVRFTIDGVEGATTLNIGGTGARPLLDLYIASPSLSANTIIKAGKLAHCMYDAVLGSWVKIGADNASGEAGIDNCVPPEICLRLAAEVGAHPWFNIPHYALVPMTDYVPQLAAYCAANAPSWMIPTYEVANEVWNTYQGFNHGWYAGRSVIPRSGGWDATWTIRNVDNWYGMAASTMGQAVAAAYGVTKANVKSQNKYRTVVAVQTAGGAQPDRFLSTLYLTQTAQPGYALDPASDWATSIAFANYFTPPIHGTATETALATQYAGVSATVNISGTTMTVLAVRGTMQANIWLRGVGITESLLQPDTKVVSGSGTTWTINKNYTTPLNSVGVYGGLDPSIPDTYAENSGAPGAFSISGDLTLYTNWKAAAQSYGIQRALAYEGGYSPDLGNVSIEVNALRAASCYSPKVAKFNYQNHTNFCGLTDGTFTAEFPSNYLLAGSIAPDPDGVIRIGSVWAVLQDIYQQPRPPQWVAMVLFNKGNATSLIVNN